MAEDWTAIAADVTAAVADIGFDITVTRKSVQDNPWDVIVTETALTLRVIDAKPWRMRAGDEITMGRSLLSAPSANLPIQGDRVTVRGVTHEVLTVRAVAPGGVDLFHIVELSA